jgi:serpin B
MRVCALVLVLAVGVALCGCSRLTQATPGRAEAAELVTSDKPRDLAPNVTPAQLGHVAVSNNFFAFDLYQRLRGDGGNLFFSPYSISTALAMAYAGARGQTAAQMAKTLRFYLPPDQLHPAFNALDLELASRGKESAGRSGGPFRLHVANALWGQTGWKFLPGFLDILAENYGAGMRLVDFAQTEAARAAINQWVSQQTEGMITDLVPASALQTQVVFVLTNAVYFDAAWQWPFHAESTAPGPFHLLDGSEISADMMHQSEVFGYAEGDGYQALQMPYRGEELAMVILLPSPGRFEEFDASLDIFRAGAILDSLARQPVIVTIPKFTYGSTFSLVKALPDMGMRDAFVYPIADFSGIDGSRLLYISAVLHKALVRVDERGTEAAAATAVIGRAGGAAGPSARPIEFTADRPFIFLIQDVKTGTILFLGRVLDPRGT